jgi:HK97 family phage major capsid protein
MTAQELREKSKELADQAQAFLTTTEETCVAEDREMNETEKAQFQTAFDESKDCIAQSRELEKEADEQRKVDLAEWRKGLDETEGRQSPRLALRASPERPLPAQLKRSGKLKGFHGPGAENRAYHAGMWIRATIFGDPVAHRFCRNAGIETRAQSGSINTAGGFLVPDIFNQAIIDLREMRGVFRQHAKVIPMGSDHMLIPRRAGGLTAYAIGDNDEITESEKSWGQVELIARKWGTLTRIPTELEEDAVISLADDLAQEIGYAFADKEDLAGFNGDGTSAFHGIHGATVKINDGNHAASIYVADTSNDAVPLLDLADFEGTSGILPQFAEAGAAWYVSKAVFWASMARLADAAGGNTKDDIAGGPARQFLGYPVVFSQVLFSTLTTSASTIVALLGDLRLAATMGDRRGVTVKRDESRYLEYDQVGIRGTTRFDINVHDLGDATDAGPIVALKTST